ncbi:MAG TPA: transglutaminaseTgpA domain-containing protein [Actinomycetota bacterium]
MSVQAPERPLPQVDQEPAPPARPALRPVFAGALASAAAAWMAGGLFRGVAPRAIALGGVLLGAGLIVWSTRTRRPTVVQYLVLPAAIVGGALLVLPETGEGSANIISLVAEALRAGGLRQPPVAFDPGWRFLLFALAAVLAAASGSVAWSLDRPKLAALVPLPVIFGAAVLQPEGSAVASSAVAIALMLGALAVAYGSELAGSADAGARFETRRLGRGAALVAALVVALVALDRASVLFPDVELDRVVPAQRPPSGASVGADRVLFTVTAGTPGPWRLGVLDVYDGSGWLLPPFDPARQRRVRGQIAGAPDADELVTARFTVGDLPGHAIPGLANPSALQTDATVELDPRTSVLRLPEQRAEPGLTYTITAPAPPGGRALAAAGPPPNDLAEFLGAPSPPNEVVALLADAPENPWDRLVFARAALFEQVVAAGAGQPVDVLPARVAELLGGEEATPFEITAAEALLARWAGVPSRIGYGFYAGDPLEPGVFEVHPRHGATWLEVFFDGHGWVPVVGVPPRARSSLSPDEQQENPNVLPTEELALIVHVPVLRETQLLLFVTVRWWLARALPVAAGALLVWWLLPGVVKVMRRVRRRRWAVSEGFVARILVAYADLRDTVTDLGVRGRTLTPLRFLEVVEPDAEHTELAWLVTRALWGDLGRDLGAEDVERAEEMARSVTRRIRRAQPGGMRLLAFGSRASLRDPYTREAPALWRARRVALVATMLAVSLGACAQAVVVAGGAPGELPPRLVPERLGEVAFRREPLAERAYEQAGQSSLVHEGRVWTLRREGAVEAYVQIASFVGGIDALDDEVRDKVLDSIGTGGFELQRLGEERAWIQQLPEQRMLLSFGDDGRSFTLLVARRTFAEADEVFGDLLRYQHGDPTGARAPVPAYDPRRGTR